MEVEFENPPQSSSASGEAPDAMGSQSTPQAVVPPELGHLLWAKVKERDYASAVSEIKKEEYGEFLAHNSLDLIPVILRLLNEDDEDPEKEKCVEELLNYVASVANVRESVLVLLEELEIHHSNIKFRVILQPIQTLLLRQVSHNARAIMFTWVFNTLYSHLAAMKIPTELSLEGKERKILDVHPDVQAVTSTLEWLIDFYQVFYEKVVHEELIWAGKEGASKEFLAFFFLQLFHRPLTYLDVYCEHEEVESSLYRRCDDLATMVAHLMGNVFKLLQHVTWTRSKPLLAAEGDVCKEDQNENIDDGADIDTNSGSDDKKDQISQLSIACYFYCIIGQNMANNFVPCVYSHQHVFLNCLPLIGYLLQEKEDLAVHKGLVLAKVLLSNLSERSLPAASLEAKSHSSFPQLLIRVMTLRDNKDLRTTALDIFRPYLRKFDSLGRRKLIRSLLLSVKHSGVLGLVIHELKENIAVSLSKHVLDPEFSGSNLVQLVSDACQLPDAEKTDLLEWSDSIMAALNLLIFIFVRDSSNKSGIQDIIPCLNGEFLCHIQTGLGLSVGHYELKLKELESGAVKKRKDQIETTVSIGNAVLPNIPVDQEKNIIQTALLTFDMMHCVLARVKQAAGLKS